MPQIAQQDYKVIAPKPGRAFFNDAAALGELKKAVLNGIGFDCLIKDTIQGDGDINRVLGFYPEGTAVSYYSLAEGEVIKTITPDYTPTQYQGLAAVQEAIDEMDGVMTELPTLENGGSRLAEGTNAYWICVDGKYLTPTASGGKLTALAIAETGPTEGFVNITWEDAQKLIGLPIS